MVVTKLDVTLHSISFNLNLKFPLFFNMCKITSGIKFNFPQQNFYLDVLHKAEIGKNL